MSQNDNPIITISVLIVFAVVVFPALLNVVVESSATLAKNAETIAKTAVHTADQLCDAQNIIEEIDARLASLPEEVIKNYPTESWEDAKVKVILENYKDGAELTQNDYLTLAEDLNKYHKLKTKIYDLERICDIKEILE